MADKGFGVKEINLIGASGTPTIESPNNINLNAVNVAISTNVSIGGTLSVTGNISIGGTLTYEDVTNIDSVGIITARTGIHIDDSITHIGDTNTNIRFPSNDNISFEVGGTERLRINDVDGVIAKHTTAANLRVQNSTAATSQVAQLDLAPANSLSGVQLRATSEEDFSTGANRTAFFSTHVRKDGTFYERLRISSEGYVHFGNSGHGTNKVGGQAVTNEDFDPYFKILATTDDHWLMQLRSDTATGSNGIFMRAGNNSNNYSMYITGRDEANPHLITRGDGNVMVGCTGPVNSELFTVQRTNGHVAYFDHTGTNDDRVIYVRHRGATGSTNRTQISFLDDNADEVGTIRSNGSSSSYNTSSDYRLKENEVAISDGITRLKTLKPYRFNFKKDPSTTVDGFFAHEVTAVPEAISGEKDGTEMQQIDQSKLVPLLTAALQEAIAKIETLETEVAALKSS